MSQLTEFEYTNKTEQQRIDCISHGMPIMLNAALPKRAMPQHIKEQLNQLTIRKRKATQ
jgi:hypothetical protein